MKNKLKGKGPGVTWTVRVRETVKSSPWKQDFLRHKYLGFVHWALGRSLFLWECFFFLFCFSWSTQKRQCTAHTQCLGRAEEPSSVLLLLLQSALSSASEMWEAAYFNRKPPAMKTPTWATTCTHTEMHPNTHKGYSISSWRNDSLNIIKGQLWPWILSGFV